jgi:ABC-type phosphate transport system permease subunit
VTAVLAHGGTAGLVVEALLAVTVLAVFAAVWVRERRARRTHGDEEPL